MPSATRRSAPFRGVLGALAPALLALAVVTLLGAGVALAVHRHGDDHASGAEPGNPAAPAPRASAAPNGGPTEPGLPLARSAAIHPTGSGRGLARLIPCYTVTSHELSRVLGTSMALVGQRAAGENGSGLSGVQREDCFWFAKAPDGPYVVLSDVTTDELRSRAGMSGWTARRYFTDVPPRTRTYLRGVGDAAYAYGPGSVGVLVGDVYLDVQVVTSDGHPLHDAVAIATLMAKLRSTLAR
ncbi:MAG: hypothetical protein ACJ735_10405 [Actinomycetes bacterium]